MLLTGVDERGREQVVLAYQRYGRGKTLVLPVQDTWLWRMHAKMDVKDPTHHTFWQRLVRWLVDGVPDRVIGQRRRPTRVQKGEPVTLTAEVLDPEYKGINDGRITARVTSPSGKVEDVPMEWTVEHDGEYRARFTPAEDGLYKVRVGGTTRDGKDVGRGARRRCGWRRATRSTSTPRCARRCCSASPKRPKAGSTRAKDAASSCRRDHVQRQGHHRRRRARAVGHADHPDAAARVDGRRVGVSAVARTGVAEAESPHETSIRYDVCVDRCPCWSACVAGVATPSARSGRRQSGRRLLAVLQRQRAVRRQVRVRAHELSVVRRPRRAVGARLAARRGALPEDLQRDLQRRRARRPRAASWAFSDPELFKFPVAYLAEPGFWYMADDDVHDAARLPAARAAS